MILETKSMTWTDIENSLKNSIANSPDKTEAEKLETLGLAIF